VALKTGPLKSGPLVSATMARPANVPLTLASKRAPAVARAIPVPPNSRVTITPIRKKPAPKPATQNSSGRWTVWNLPWPAVVSDPFEFPPQPILYRLVSVCLTSGPLGAVSFRPGLTILDGAGNTVADLPAPPQSGAFASDQPWTWAENLDRQTSLNGSAIPATTAPLPANCIITPNMSWRLLIDATLFNFAVRGVTVVTEALEFPPAP